MEQEQEYVTIDEAAEISGIKRGSIYSYLKALNIETKRFKLSKKAYILRQDAERIKEAKAKPWTAGEEKKDVA